MFIGVTAMPDMLDLESQRLISNFIAASAPLETYLQQGGPLTPLQVESITLTMSGLQTFLDVWKRMHGITDEGLPGEGSGLPFPPLM
jgi:hypothetical protein